MSFSTARAFFRMSNTAASMPRLTGDDGEQRGGQAQGGREGEGEGEEAAGARREAAGARRLITSNHGLIT